MHLHFRRIGRDLEERHAHLLPPSPVVFLVFKAPLHQHRLNALLLVEGLQARERLLQHVLSGALLRDGRLELLVLRLPLLARDLHLQLSLLDLLEVYLDLLLEPGDDRVRLVDKRRVLLNLPVLKHDRFVVLAQVFQADILLDDLVGLHLLELRHGVVDRTLDLGESLRVHRRVRADREARERRTAGLLARRQQHLRAAVAGLALGGGELDEGEGLAEVLLGVVVAQDRDGLGDGGDLVGARLGPQLEVLVRLLAPELQLLQELLVGAEGLRTQINNNE